MIKNMKEKIKELLIDDYFVATGHPINLLKLILKNFYPSPTHTNKWLSFRIRGKNGHTAFCICKKNEVLRNWLCVDRDKFYKNLVEVAFLWSPPSSQNELDEGRTVLTQGEVITQTKIVRQEGREAFIDFFLNEIEYTTGADLSRESGENLLEDDEK